jgi:hypothetical protein
LHEHPGKGMPRIPGNHHPQYIDVVHREHAVIETGGSGPLRPWARGRTRSSPAGSGTAPCLHPPDQPRPSPRRERKHGLRSREPALIRVSGHRRATAHGKQTDKRSETRCQHNQ